MRKEIFSTKTFNEARDATGRDRPFFPHKKEKPAGSRKLGSLASEIGRYRRWRLSLNALQLVNRLLKWHLISF